jgi:hypothetical protein
MAWANNFYTEDRGSRFFQLLLLSYQTTWCSITGPLSTITTAYFILHFIFAFKAFRDIAGIHVGAFSFCVF